MRQEVSSKWSATSDTCHYCLRSIIQREGNTLWWHKYTGAVRCGSTGVFSHYLATPLGLAPKRVAAPPERIG